MRHTAIIVGGGHNGLVCAFYLARAGLSVQVFERRSVLGGAAVTEEFHPGFRNSAASYTVSLLHPRIIEDMRLHHHGLRILDRPLANFIPSADGRYLKSGGGLARTQAEVAKFSKRDAERLPLYYQRIEAVADALREVAMQTPPNLGDGVDGFVRALRQGNVMRRMPVEIQRELLDLFTLSAREVIERWFESETLKALLGFDAIIGAYTTPEAPGTAYVLLHHLFGIVNGKKGNWGHAVGGMGSITQCMAQACRDVGVKLHVDSPVEQVLSENGLARGIRLANGQEVYADIVASNLNPKLLFEKMVAASELPDDFRQRISQYKNGSGSFRMNVALSELPDFRCLPGTAVAEHHQAGIYITPTLDYMHQAYVDATVHGWSQKPVVEILIPSTVDSSLAPAGAHVASLFCQHFAPTLPNGRSWDDAREAAADGVIDTVTEWAPNFKRSVIGRKVLSPLDLERTFGLVAGDIMHGALRLNQLWSARPVLGHGSYRAPVKGLYMCGSGTHPGGGVSGMPGYNAAREILRDHQGGYRLRALLHGL